MRSPQLPFTKEPVDTKELAIVSRSEIRRHGGVTMINGLLGRAGATDDGAGVSAGQSNGLRHGCAYTRSGLALAEHNEQTASSDQPQHNNVKDRQFKIQTINCLMPNFKNDFMVHLGIQQ